MTENKCYKKVHATRALAKRAMRLINTSGKLARKITNVYYCDTCSGYHLTSLKKKKSRYFNRIK
jgi:hypothetical protein